MKDTLPYLLIGLVAFLILSRKVDPVEELKKIAPNKLTYAQQIQLLEKYGYNKDWDPSIKH